MHFKPLALFKLFFSLIFFVLISSQVFSQSADFNTQHIQNDVARTGGTNSTFTAVSSLNSAFVLANNNRKTHAGSSTSSGNREGDDMAGARQLTATNTLTYYRESGSSSLNMRFNSSIWEYVGPVGGANEMIVRGRYAISLNGGTNSLTQTLAGVVNANKCIPFITGIMNNATGDDADSGTALAYLENAATLRILKGSNGNNVTVYITVVEFTGSNWTVLHGDSGSNSGDTGTISIRDGSDGTGASTNVSAWSEAIIFSQHIGDTNTSGTNDAIADNWPVMNPGSNNHGVDWTFSSGHDSGGLNRHFVHVLTNSNLNVTRYQNTSNSSGESTINISSAGLSDINQALIVGSSISSGGGSAYGRGWRNYYLNSITQAAHWTHRSGNTMSHEIQIIDLSGLTSPTPEIDIQGNATSIADGDTTPSSTDDTDFGSLNVTSGTNPNIFTIENTGTADLTITSITSSNNAEFAVSGTTSTTIAAGNTVTFTVTFDPAVTGVRTSTITIVNDDSDENPYTFDVQGTGFIPAPEIDVVGNAVSISDGDTTPSVGDDTDFGSVLVSSGTDPNIFTIQNTGTVDLTITSVTSSNNTEFIVSGTTSGVISAGSSATFTVTFDPNAIGTRTSTITVISDDADEGTYTFDVEGEGTSPTYCTSSGNGSDTFTDVIRLVEFNTINNPTPTEDNDYSDFTSQSTDVTRNSSYDLTVNVNTGGDYRYHVWAWIDWNQDGDFDDAQENFDLGDVRNVTNGSPSLSPINITIPNFASLGFTRMRISSKWNSNPTSCETSFDGEVEDYSINVIAVIPGPEINIQGGSPLIDISDGDITPSFSDDTDFGNVDVVSGTNPNSFTIENIGTSDLTITSVTSSNNVEFAVTGTTSGIITAGNSETFTITFNPSSLGPKTSTITIVSDDVDESTYTFDVAGVGINQTFSEVIVSVNWPNYSSENKVEIYSPSGTLITTIDNGYTGATNDSHLETVNLGCLEDLSNYYIIMYDIGSGGAGDGWDGADNITITVGGTTVINQNGDAANSGGVTAYFNVSGASCTPLTEGPGGVVSDLKLWLKANDGHSYTNGQNVALWETQARGSNATVNTSGQEPTYRDAAAFNVNFNPVVDFDSSYTLAPSDDDYSYDNLSGDFLEGTSGMYTQDIFLVIIPNTTVNSTFGNMDLFCGDEDISNDETDVTGLGFGLYSNRFTDETLSFAVGPSTENPPYIGYGVSDSGATNNYDNVGIINARNNLANSQQELYYNSNNVEEYHNDLPDFSNVNDSRYWIGRSEGYEASTNARIAEIITYSSRKNDVTERNKIESYLGIKYGITLGVNGTSQDYVDSDGTVIWDQSVNNGYNYDIAGIGRDDASELNQKQSKSVNNESDVSGPTQGILTIGLNEIYDTNNENISTNSANTFGDKQFLVWGNNGVVLDLAATTINVDMSAGISDLSTPVTFTGMQRIWKVVETGGDISKVKISLPKNAVRNITPPGSYLMFISDTEVFSPTADYRVMTDDSVNLTTEYDFDGTKYITFGYAPEIIEERSIYFDGSNDYIDMEDALDLNTTEFTMSAWIKRGAGSTNKSILSKRDVAYSEGYDFKINSNNKVELSINVNTNVIVSDFTIPQDEWHHIAVIYDNGTANLYIDGILDKTESLTNPVGTNQSFFIAAAGKNAPTSYFEGNIDEVRVWDVALTVDQLRFIMNQEIIDSGSNFVNGKILPQTITKNEVSLIPWSNLAGYYPMSVYTFTNTNDASGNNNQGALRNLDTVDHQTAPLPYESKQTGNWDTPATWLNGSLQYVPNSTINGTKVDWNIVETNHNVNSTRNVSVLGLSINSNELTVDGDNSTATGNGLTVTHYLKLDGVLDLEGESQLIQTTDSDFDDASTGYLERDQQGVGNKFRYNDWSSPVYTEIDNDGFGIDGNYTSIESVLKDGKNGGIDINFVGGYDGNDSTNPIQIANYWLYKFVDDLTGDYSKWVQVGKSGRVYAGQGFLMKGTGNPGASEQNYIFKGKPNNGTITLVVNNDNDYLVGNPYPSAIDVRKFLDDNSPSGTGSIGNGGAIYFWEHYGGDSHNLRDYQAGYATLNLSGGVRASSGSIAGLSTLGTPAKTPEFHIPIGQGFFVQGDGDGGDIVFKNSQRVFEIERVTGTNDGSVFMKSSSKKTKTSYQENERDNRFKVRVGFDGPKVSHRQLLLTIDENSSDAVDWGYDAFIYESFEDDMYWVIDEGKYVIQATNKFSLDKEVPIGIRTSGNGVVKIKIDALENVDENIVVYIKDVLTGETYDITNEPFEIELEAGEYKDRFVITFQPRLKTLNEITLTEGLLIYMNNTISELQINKIVDTEILSVNLFNFLGQEVTTWNSNFHDRRTSLPIKNSTGVYIVKVNTTAGIISQKIIIK